MRQFIFLLEGNWESSGPLLICAGTTPRGKLKSQSLSWAEIIYFFEVRGLTDRNLKDD